MRGRPDFCIRDLEVYPARDAVRFWFALKLFLSLLILSTGLISTGRADDFVCDHGPGSGATVRDRTLCDAFRVYRDDDAMVDPRLVQYVYDGQQEKGHVRSFALIVSVSKYNTQLDAADLDSTGQDAEAL